MVLVSRTILYQHQRQVGSKSTALMDVIKILHVF